MAEQPTYCDQCDLAESVSRKGPAWRWLCTAHPRLPGFNRFVTHDAWQADEPYLRCVEVNGGLCRLFTPLRTPEGEF